MTKKTARAFVAHNVRELRLQAGLSQDVLAENCGFHRTYISQLERQVTNITLDNLERVAHTLGVPLTRLVTEA